MISRFASSPLRESPRWNVGSTPLHRPASTAVAGVASSSSAPADGYWSRLEAAGPEATLRDLFNASQERSLLDLLGKIDQAGYTFYGGVSADKAGPRSIEEMRELFLDNPVEMRSKVWVAGEGEPLSRIDSALDLQLLEELTSPTQKGTLGLIALTEKFGPFEYFDVKEKGMVKAGRLTALERLEQGEKVSLEAGADTVRISTVEGAGAADYFFGRGLEETVEDPALAGLVGQRLTEGYEFPSWGQAPVYAYLAARRGDGDLKLEYKDVAVGTLRAPDLERRQFFATYFEPVKADEKVMDFVLAAKDGWPLEIRAELVSGLYEQLREAPLGPNQWQRNTLEEVEKVYKALKKSDLADPRPEARKIGQLLSHLGFGDSRRTVDFVLEELPILGSPERAEAAFQRTLSAVGAGLPLERARELADLGELDGSPEVLDTIGRLARHAAENERYQSEQRDYLALISQPGSREVFFETLRLCTRLERPELAQTVYRDLCDQSADGQVLESVPGSLKKHLKGPLPDLSWEGLEKFSQAFTQVRQNWRYTDPLPALALLFQPWNGEALEDRLVLIESLADLGDRSHTRDSGVLLKMVQGISSRVKGGMNLAEAHLEAERALGMEDLKVFSQHQEVDFELLEDAVQVGDVVIDVDLI